MCADYTPSRKDMIEERFGARCAQLSSSSIFAVKA